MKMRLIGDKLSVELFKIAGISGKEMEKAEGIEETINMYLDDPDVGVILVTNSCASKLGARFHSYLERRKLPMVLRIPDRFNRTGASEDIKQYVKRTLGIRM